MPPTRATAGATIEQVQLKGHKSSVLCLAHSSNVHHNTATTDTAAAAITCCCLLSGSEDETARLWDLRAPLRASLCIKAPGEVMSVAFSRKEPPRIGNVGPFARDFCVYLAVGHQVLGYDLRKATSPIILEPVQDLTLSLETTDEVNQLSFSSGRSGPVYIAAADDSGYVRVSDTLYPSIQSQGRRKFLHHDPHQQALVTCAAFHPKINAELCSGGTDCTLNLWNMNKPHKATHSLLIPRDDGDSDAGVGQICNPPMVHSLAWSPSGRWIVAGLGDGTIQVTDKSLTPRHRLRGGHTTGVASVCFCEFTTTVGQTVDVNDRIVASGGSDGNVVLWDLGMELAGKFAVNPLANINPLDDDLSNLSLETKTRMPRVLFAIPHGSKVNCIASSRALDPIFPSTLFVADTSNDITAYTLPL